jgi:predicted nucleic acid-binding protein
MGEGTRGVTIVVADAGPIIHLSLVGRIDLLPSLFGRLLVPETVYREVVETGEGLPGSAELREADWFERAPHDPRADLFRLLRAQLDPGEAAALWLAASRKAALVLSDDRQARVAAESLGIAVRGTVGLLVQAKRQGHLSEISPLLLDLKGRGAWISDKLIERVLREVGEPIS